jgi:hypothetical protein
MFYSLRVTAKEGQIWLFYFIVACYNITGQWVTFLVFVQCRDGIAYGLINSIFAKK